MSVIDWASKPEPWSWIGPQFRRECERIAKEDAVPLPWRLLAARRKALGLSQRSLAVEAGVSDTIIGNAELGEYAPSPKHLAALYRLERERQP